MYKLFDIFQKAMGVGHFLLNELCLDTPPQLFIYHNTKINAGMNAGDECRDECRG